MLCTRRSTKNCYSRLLSKKSRIRIVTLVLAVFMMLTFSLTGCDSLMRQEPDKPTEIKIGVSIYDEYDTFISSMTRRMNEWCKEKELETGVKITLEIVSAKSSQLTQNDQVDKFISKGYDAVCVNLVDRTDASVIIDKAKAANIPVVFFNRELVKEDLERWDGLYYVGARPEQSGRLQAQIIIDELRKPLRMDEIDFNHNDVIQYVMLEGEAGHQDALIRTQTSIETLKEAGYELEKIGDEIANWDRTQAKTKMAQLLERYPIQIELVICNNDDMALGALEAIEESGISNKPYVVGINGTDEAMEAVRTGRLGGTVYNDAVGQSDVIMKMAYSIAMGEEFSEDVTLVNEKYVYLPYSIVTYDNVQQYLSPGT